MTPLALAEGIFAVWLAAAIVYQIAAQLALRGFLSRARRPRAEAGSLPTATILVPLGGGRDRIPRMRENLARLCAAGAPVVAGVDEDGGEGIGCDGSPTVVAGAPAEGSNRKIALLIRMLPEAHGEILVFIDGDIGVPEGYLEALLAPFADPAVGMVTCPYRSVGGTTIASRVDAVITNTVFLPSVTLAERLEGVRFALGATMAIRRGVLDAIGGLEPLLERLADDWSLADRARQAGHRIVLAPLLLEHHVGEPGWSGLWQRHLRWARTMRSVRPSGFAGTFVAHGWAPALALAALGGWRVAVAVMAAWAVVRCGTVALNARRTRCRALDLLLLPAADALSAALYVGGLCGRTVRWGGSLLRVGPGGAILARH